MNVRIRPSALADLADGYAFYEKQEPGLGGYFLDSAASSAHTDCWVARFRSPFTTM